MVDLISVDLEGFSRFANQLQEDNYNEDDTSYSRSKLHYLAHVLTGHAIFTPSKYTNHITEDIKSYLINHFYQKIPLLGALCIIDLENVLKHREEKVVDKNRKQ